MFLGKQGEPCHISGQGRCPARRGEGGGGGGIYVIRSVQVSGCPVSIQADKFTDASLANIGTELAHAYHGRSCGLQLGTEGEAQQAAWANYQTT